MDPDEIVYNEFYHTLRNEYTRKYDLALSKCWNICVPAGNSLRGLPITDEFVDDHILKPHPEIPHHFTSIGEDNSCLYKFENTSLKLIEENESTKVNCQHKVGIVSIEKGYNKEFQVYVILVMEMPIHPKYISPNSRIEDEVKLNCSVVSYKDARGFLDQLSDQANTQFDKLKSTLKQIDLDDFNSSEELSSMLQDLTRRYWAIIMRKQSLCLQRDARFQKLLSTSLEVFIMHFMYDKIYYLLSRALLQEDMYLNKKLSQFFDAGITPDQLGADESLAISLPAAIVELATLDAREGPLEKSLCLRSTLDLIVAEVKAAIAEVQTKTENDEITVSSFVYTQSTDELIPLLIYVIVKSRPKRLVTDLHYIKNFLWSASPRDGLSDSLCTFEAAVGILFHLEVHDLPGRSRKVKTELPIGELFDVIARSDQDFTPLDRQIHQLATMLEKCTQN
ncbi:ankyrin repeat domain-containing protein 27-like [Neodiprion virginianus]|uniref:ankyrin repeat domain-containing protein 27-like n=1 Tax=Neodiprion virginianus TaxID=2961670 RepID=UPI001EE74D6A|nr:ankyrin repeat domain-containing protein 27-like [Neodiprion virginianus]